MQFFNKAALFTALVTLFISFSFSASNAQVTPPQPDTYMLKGQVIDAQTEANLADAEIQILGQDIAAATDTEGKFKLTNLPGGEHTLKVTLDGYQAWEKSVTLDQDAQLKIKLKPEKKQQ